MSACVFGLLVWKALDARTAALAQSQRDIRNLAHSLAEHASHTIQAADVAMSGMVDLLKYQRPRADRFKQDELAKLVSTLGSSGVAYLPVDQFAERLEGAPGAFGLVKLDIHHSIRRALAVGRLLSRGRRVER